MSKKILIVLAAVIIVGAVFYVYNKREAKAPTVEKSATEMTGPQATSSVSSKDSQATSSQPSAPAGKTVTKDSAGGADYAPGQFSSGDETADGGANVQVVEVSYDGTSFTPARTDISVGDWVFFVNKSDKSFWPASNPHPQHTGYAGFDAGKAVAAGGKYKFQFTKAGSFGYHDHFNPSAKGEVVVSGK